jgi:hypothetical protein
VGGIIPIREISRHRGSTDTSSGAMERNTIRKWRAAFELDVPKDLSLYASTLYVCSFFDNAIQCEKPSIYPSFVC